nr:VIT and VWA domain-containing protein [Myxococcales bacterium]
MLLGWVTLASWGTEVATLPGAQTSMTVHVTGPLASVELHRTFDNPLDWPITAELQVPVPAGAAVDHLTVTVNERVLSTEIRDRARARVDYARALQAGSLATLLEDAAPGLVSQRVANIDPGARVSMELRMVVPVSRTDGVWELAWPMSVTPRFAVDDPRSVPALYHVEASQEHTPGVDVSLTVHGGALPVAWIDAVSHPTSGSLDGSDARIALRNATPNRDLVVRWGMAGVQPELAAWTGEQHGLLLIEPPASGVATSPPPRDVVVLVDTSESTQGPLSAQLTEGALHLLSKLRPEDRFTVLAFDDVVRGISVRQPPTPAALRQAQTGLQALPRGGGTALALALRFALALPVPEERPLSVVLLSDAAVAHEWDAIRQVVSSGRATVHTAAFGAAPHDWLLTELAHASGGTTARVTPSDDVIRALAPVATAMTGPVLTDLQVEWPGATVLEDPLPDLYAGRALVLHTKGTSDGAVTVRGALAGDPWERTLVPEPVADPRPVTLAWGRAAVAQQTRLDRRGDPNAAATGRSIALSYGLVSPWTSLVAVDGAPVTDSVRSVTLVQGHALPGAGRRTIQTLSTGRSYTISGSAENLLIVGSPLPRLPLGASPPWHRVFAESAVPLGPTVVGGVPGSVVHVDGQPVTDLLTALLPARAPVVTAQRQFLQPAASHLELPASEPRWLGSAGVHGVVASPSASPSGQVRLSGPLVGKRLGVSASGAADQRVFDDVRATWAAGHAKADLKVSDHRLALSALGDVGRATDGTSTVGWSGASGALQWQTPQRPSAFSATLSATGRRWGPATSRHQHAAGNGRLVAGPGRALLGMSLARDTWRTPSQQYAAWRLSTPVGWTGEVGETELRAELRHDALDRQGDLQQRWSPHLYASLRLGRSRLSVGGQRQVQPELAVPEALSTLAAPDRWSADAQVQQDLGGDLVAGLSTAV